MSTVASQFAKLALRLGEPENEDDRRFTPAQMLLALNPARRAVAEESQSLQCDDTQNTTVGGKLYNLPLDVIDFYAVEWDGIELEVVPVDQWRRVIGSNDALRGAPQCVKYHARQLQLFPVPDQVKALRYHGYCYPTALAVGGTDSEFTSDQEEAAIWKAAADMKAADERDFDYEEKQAARLIQKLAEQYKPKGPRYVKGSSSVNPIWHMLRGGS